MKPFGTLNCCYFVSARVCCIQCLCVCCLAAGAKPLKECTQQAGGSSALATHAPCVCRPVWVHTHINTSRCSCVCHWSPLLCVGCWAWFDMGVWFLWSRRLHGETDYRPLPWWQKALISFCWQTQVEWGVRQNITLKQWDNMSFIWKKQGDHFELIELISQIQIKTVRKGLATKF